MGYIVHGPQGCGKTSNSNKLQRKYRVAEVLEHDQLPRDHPAHGEALYSREGLIWLKRSDVLVLTSLMPPPRFKGNRYIVSYRKASQWNIT